MTIPTMFSVVGEWSPAALSPAQWFISDKGIALGAGVQIASWADQSGHGKNAVQATAGNQPTVKAAGLNGRATVAVSGAGSQFLTHGLTLPSPCTVIAVAKTANVGAYSAIASWGGGVGGVYFYASADSDDTWGLYENGNVDAGSTLHTFKIVVAIIRAPNDVDLRTNGSSVHVTTGVSDFSAPSQIGAGLANGAQNLNGEIAELIAVAQPISVAQAQTAESYLRNAWAL